MPEIITNRWYNDACGTAFALELIGERWTVLILRELMFGPRRFGELRSGLPGISAKVLSARLATLEDNSILRKHGDGTSGATQVYELTPWGYEAESLVQDLGRWATRHPGHDPTLPLSAASIIMSFKTMLSADRAQGFNHKIGFNLNGETFVVTIKQAKIEARRANPKDADCIFTADPTLIAAAVYGGVALSDLQSSGQLQIDGNIEVARQFTTLFVLPEKISLT
ncbi:winged helix-turn-helix transcriptional regulator [Robiginitomaculum antarcticum]|uniref:winged helix-turn-helix transcriptional regulator n=1 Tax=Robiginitomaculum antarcticum TaxID=437507 RepID=UPI000375A74A|nr:winged helix-turn-helix transcriptional regulator [Robiginitomaculum antarcticum]